jgi:hypothetical protein
MLARLTARSHSLRFSCASRPVPKAQEAPVMTNSISEPLVLGLASCLAWPLVALVAIYFAYRAILAILSYLRASGPSLNATPAPSKDQQANAKTPIDTRRMTWWGALWAVSAAVLALKPSDSLRLGLPQLLLIFSMVTTGVKFFYWTHQDLLTGTSGSWKTSIMEKVRPLEDKDWLSLAAVLLFAAGFCSLWLK